MFSFFDHQGVLCASFKFLLQIAMIVQETLLLECTKFRFIEKHCKIQIDLFSLKELKLTYLSESYLSLKRMVFLNAVKESLLCFVGFYNTMFCFISQEDEDEMVVQLGSSGDEDEREDPLSFIPTPENSDESGDDSEDDV